MRNISPQRLYSQLTDEHYDDPIIENGGPYTKLMVVPHLHT